MTAKEMQRLSAQKRWGKMAPEERSKVMSLSTMKYVLIVNDGLHGHWYHFDDKAEMFRWWQQGGMSIMYEYIGNQLVQLEP